MAAWFSLLRTLAIRQLMLDQSAIIDDIVGDGQLEEWRKTAASFSARLILIECVCSDEAVHRERIQGRTRGIPGWHEIGWDHVERMRREVPVLAGDRLTVDAIQPLDDNYVRVRDYISA